MKLTDDEFEAANSRAEALKAAFPPAIAVRYDRRVSRVVITLASGLQLAFAPRDVQGLEKAVPADLAEAQISPSGLGVHFPKLDADLYIPALLEGFLGSKRWMASQMGKMGGDGTVFAGPLFRSSTRRVCDQLPLRRAVVMRWYSHRRYGQSEVNLRSETRAHHSRALSQCHHATLSQGETPPGFLFSECWVVEIALLTEAIPSDLVVLVQLGADR
ncbi:DUF2442 domain-containing protein [Pseudoduganella sp. UC29_106]|uniref:DUF2442 domain-containing protein n=1 Tax=Pseudoduganella sp. UC29_106 TaxID=3374553 RepID=UPI003756433A